MVDGLAERRNGAAQLVLAEGAPAPAGLGVQLHERSIDLLTQRIDAEQPQPHLDRRLGRALAHVMAEQLRQRLQHELPQPLSLGQQPLLEWRLLDGQSREEISPIQRHGPLERVHRPAGRVALEGRHVDVDGGPVQGHRGPIQDERRGIRRGERPAKAEQRLAKAISRGVLPPASPEHRGQLVAGMWPARGDRQVGHQRLRFP
jgi:hypothetical protein